MPEKIGFVGVGRMGSNMARRLKDCGYTISAVYDARGKVARDVGAELGAEPCKNLARVSELSDVVITVVSDDDAMDKIFAAKGSSLLKNAKGKIFINCATVSPDTHIEVEKRAQAAGAESLEACMASSITQAREGSLYLMIGGEETAFQRVRPILEKLSGSMRYIGKAGQAANVKALVNMVMNINTAGLSEGLLLAKRSESISRPCARSSLKPALARASCKPMARTCRTANIRASFPPRMRPKIPALRWP